MERLTVDGAIYSVPSNIHRNNVVWASVSVLKAAGLDPAKPAQTIDAWISDMEKIKAAGYTPTSPYTPKTGSRPSSPLWKARPPTTSWVTGR